MLILIGGQYTLIAERMVMAPDGYQRESLVFNGSVPGSTIEADWGDDVVIHVVNNIPDNGTAIHWHGSQQPQEELLHRMDLR